MNKDEPRPAGGPHNSGNLHNSGKAENTGGPHNSRNPHPSGDPHIAELLGIALKAALEAGAEILEVYKSEDFDVQHKSDDSPLTLADRRAHETIQQVLQASGIPLLSEEGADIPLSERKKWDLYWLVDPLDGTKEFIKRNGEFTVNIALMASAPTSISRGSNEPSGSTLESGSPAESFYPTAGVVYVPVKDTAYIGMQGKGAWKGALKGAWKGAWRVEQASELLNILGSSGSPSSLGQNPASNAAEKPSQGDNPAAGAGSKADASPQSFSHPDIFSLLDATGIRLPAVDPASRPFSAVVSRSHNSPETEELVANLEARHGPAERVSSGSSVKLCLVAEGTADVYPRFAPTMEWDTAAGDAVCRAAGCMVTGQDRKTPLVYNKEDLHNPWFVVLGPRMF